MPHISSLFPVQTSPFIRQKDKKILYLCLLFTFFWGFLAHGYGFLHSSFSHDVLNAVYAGSVEDYWKMQLGRFLVVGYRRLFRGQLALPWLCGILSLLWVSCSVFLTAKIFSIEQKLPLLLIAGLFTANSTFTAMTATYIYELDADMLALLFACLSCRFWQKDKPCFLLAGSICVWITLGLYQSYLSVTIGLIILFCLLSIINNKSFLSVLILGTKGILMLLFGGLFYLASCRILGAVFHFSINSGSYNSLGAAFSDTVFHSFRTVYQTFFQAFFDTTQGHITHPVFILHLICFFLLLVFSILQLARKDISWTAKALYFVLILVFPFGVNLACFLTGGMVHALMTFAFVLVYLFLLLVFFQSNPQKTVFSIGRMLSAGLLILLIWNQVQFSNAAYLKKELEYDATLSYMTRVEYMLESRDDYIPGETNVVFVGTSELLHQTIPGFEQHADLTGLDSSCAIPTSNAEYYYNAYKAYYSYILNTPISMPTYAIWNRLNTLDDVRTLPCFPAKDCTLWIDDVLVVKLGNEIW